MAVASSVAWDRLAQLVATGTQLSNTLADEPLAYVGQGYHRFRRYAPRMLRCLKLEAAPVAGPLVAAALSIGEMKGVASPERRFLRPSSKWNRHLRAQEKGDTRLWEVAVLFHLRDAFRSGDVWLAHSRRYGDLKQVLVPMIAAQENAKLAVPSNPQDWLADRKARLTIALKRLARAARNGTIPHGSIEDGTLRIDRLTADVPDGAEALILDLYRRMPSVRITDMLLEVDAALGFTDAFTHLRTGAPCRDRIGLLNVLLAEGLNLGLRKMAEATNTHDYWQLSRLARWHVESEAMNGHWQLWWPRRVNCRCHASGDGHVSIERWSVFPDSAAWRSHEHGQCQIWFCSRPQSVYSRKRPVRAIRLSVDPGDRERGTVYSRWTTDERGRSPCSRTVCRYSRVHRPFVRSQ